MTVKEFFAKHPSASSTAREWCEQYATMSEAWAACKRPDWMLWAVRAEENTDANMLRRIACRCVRETPLSGGRVVWDLLTDERSRTAVEVAERYIAGEATGADLDAAQDAAREAAREAARDAAWEAAQDAAWDAAWAARAAAWDAPADIIREVMGDPFAE